MSARLRTKKPRVARLGLLAALIAAAGQTADDQQDAAAGLIPRSLRSDALHLNDAGYAIVAAAWVAGTIAMGW